MSAPFVRARTGECSLPYGHSIPYFSENVTLFLGKRRKSVDSTKEDWFPPLTSGKKWNTIPSGGRCIPSCLSFIPFSCWRAFPCFGKARIFSVCFGRAKENPRPEPGAGEILGVEAPQRWPPRREERRSLSLRSDRRLSDACMNCFRRASKSAGPAAWGAAERASCR